MSPSVRLASRARATTEERRAGEERRGVRRVGITERVWIKGREGGAMRVELGACCAAAARGPSPSRRGVDAACHGGRLTVLLLLFFFFPFLGVVCFSRRTRGARRVRRGEHAMLERTGERRGGKQKMKGRASGGDNRRKGKNAHRQYREDNNHHHRHIIIIIVVKQKEIAR